MPKMHKETLKEPCFNIFDAWHDGRPAVTCLSVISSPRGWGVLQTANRSG